MSTGAVWSLAYEMVEKNNIKDNAFQQYSLFIHIRYFEY